MRILILLFSMHLSLQIYAKDFGHRGQTYPINEQNLLEVIYQKLTMYKKTGQLDKIKKDFQAQVERTAIRPNGSELKKALSTKVSFFDPSLTLQKTIKDHKGEIIADKGKSVNPLDYIQLSKELIFINADRVEELEFAAKKLKNNADNKIILVNGNIKNANKFLNNPVYFDQSARLINRFNLQATPSVISQEGKLLKITEVAL